MLSISWLFLGHTILAHAVHGRATLHGDVHFIDISHQMIHKKKQNPKECKQRSYNATTAQPTWTDKVLIN